MFRIYLLLILAIFMTPSADATVWATAISKNEKAGTAIVYRYIKKFPSNFRRESQSQRIIITWKYQGEKGMPPPDLQARMNELEDALQPAVEGNGLSTLALVSTGDGLKEWIYYSKSESQFFEQLNKALAKLKPFPIEIHVAADPKWKSYEDFQTQVKK